MKRIAIALAATGLSAAAAAALVQHAGHDPKSPPPSAAPQPTALEGQLAAVRAGVARYADFEVARREGWRKFGGDGPLVGEHWFLPTGRGGIDYKFGEDLDFRRPSSLMYTDIGGKKVLTGVTFNVRLAKDEPVPEGFAGSGDVWHVHDFRAFFGAALQDRPAMRKFVERAMERRWNGRERLAMIHVWEGPIPNPDGVFAHYNRLVPYLKLGLPEAMAAGGSIGAARGLNLATPEGCEVAIDGALKMAGAQAAGKQLHELCAEEAAKVRAALALKDKVRINVAAEQSWQRFDGLWNRLLSADQKARIAAVTEHDHPVPSQGEAPHKHH